MKVNHLDLFSGIGGFSLALDKAVPDRVGWTGYSDIDKYANQVFKRRFPNAEELGSVVDINPDTLPERIDLVTFGSPCQDFSIAGKRGGIRANRSGLFFEAMRIIRAKKPKYFIFENVKGLFSSGGGEDFAIVLREIADSGYDGGWELLNSRHYGVPQNRERIYFVGHLRGECRPEVFPLRENDGKNETQGKGIDIVGHSGSGGQKGCIYSTDGISSCLNASDYKQPKQIEIADYRNDEGLRIGIKTVGIIPESDKPKGNWLPRERVLETENGISRAISTSESQHPYYKIRNPYKEYKSVAYRTRNYKGEGGKIEERNDDLSNALNTQPKDYMVKSLNKNQQEKWDKYDVDSSVSGTITEAFGRGGSSSEYVKMLKKNKEITGQIRRLTPVECSRLQGFPDDWNDCCSDTQRYKQMGNAITVNVAEAIFRRLYEPSKQG